MFVRVRVGLGLFCGQILTECPDRSFVVLFVLSYRNNFRIKLSDQYKKNQLLNVREENNPNTG